MTASAVRARSAVPIGDVATTDRRRLAGRCAASILAGLVFVAAVALIGHGLRHFSGGLRTSGAAVTVAPFAWLALGTLAAILVRSSTAVLVTVSAALGAGAIGSPSAIWVLMGAQLGVSAPCVAAALHFTGRPPALRRALAAAAIPDLQQSVALAVLAPLELHVHVIERCSAALATVMGASLLGPAAQGTPSHRGGGPAGLAVQRSAIGSQEIGPVLTVLGGIVLCVVALRVVGHFLQVLVAGRRRAMVLRAVAARPATALCYGAASSVLTQSPALTQVMLVRFTGAGAIQPGQIWWMTLGANIGTLPAALATAAIGANGSGPAACQLCLAQVLLSASTIVLCSAVLRVRSLVQWLAAGATSARPNGPGVGAPMPTRQPLA